MVYKITDKEEFSWKDIISDYFSLQVKQNSRMTKIKMCLHTDFVNTRDIPGTYDFLKKNLPGIFNADCFNEDKLPFYEEVKETEIGHLFEHILLEYLCKYNNLMNNSVIEISGETCWDWHKDKRGSFEIVIDFGSMESEIFSLALKNSIVLLNEIINNKILNTQLVQLSS